MRGCQDFFAGFDDQRQIDFIHRSCNGDYMVFRDSAFQVAHRDGDELYAWHFPGEADRVRQADSVGDGRMPIGLPDIFEWQGG